jgi:hypothetical protein
LLLLAALAFAAAPVMTTARGGAPAAQPVAAAAEPDGGSVVVLPTPADKPVSLADAQEFNAPAPEIGQVEITEARRALASAVSAEKFMDGATAVLVAYLIYLVVF